MARDSWKIHKFGGTSLADAHLRMYEVLAEQSTGRFIGAPGDIDGDGLADVMVTAHRWDAGDRGQAGRVYGILGSHPSGTLYLPDDADLVIVGSDTNDYVGRGIAPAGDRNGDGFLEREDLRRAFGPGVDVDALVAAADTDGVDRISHKDWLVMKARLAEAYPATDAGVRMRLEALSAERGRLEAAFRPLFLATALVLLLACANVAVLLVTRSGGRRAEPQLRAAVGAERRQLAMYLLLESALLAAAGAFVALFVGSWLLGLVLPLAPERVLPGLAGLGVAARELPAPEVTPHREQDALVREHDGLVHDERLRPRPPRA